MEKISLGNMVSPFFFVVQSLIKKIRDKATWHPYSSVLFFCVCAELIHWFIVLYSRSALVVSKSTTETFLVMRSLWTLKCGKFNFYDGQLEQEIVQIFFRSYAGDCDIRFSVKGIKGGIKDFQVCKIIILIHFSFSVFIFNISNFFFSFLE